MYNGLSQVYCIKLEGRIHQYTKWLKVHTLGFEDTLALLSPFDEYCTVNCIFLQVFYFRETYVKFHEKPPKIMVKSLYHLLM